MRFLATVVVLALATLSKGGVQTRTIEYKQGGVTLEGFLAWDDAVASEQNRRPGIVVCPEWWGNNEYAHTRARQLAELGYVALAIDMYGKGQDGALRVTKDPKQAGQWAGEVMKDPGLLRERAQAGLKVLTDQKIVDSERLAAIGYCMGGTVALELARTGADLKAVVAFHASKIAASTTEDNAKIKATLLICHGQDDAFVQPGEVDKFHAQMKAAGVDYCFVAYASAVHAFTNPGADSAGIDGVKYNEKADKRSWEHMKALFVEKFGAVTKASRSTGGAAIPGPLSDDAVAKLGRTEAMNEFASRRTAQRDRSMDAATRVRLSSEVEKLRGRLDESRRAPEGR